MAPDTPQNLTAVLVELGAGTVLLALLARVAHRLAFSAIPLYLVAGLAFGRGGLLPLGFSEHFNHVGAEIGVLLLLFMMGLEMTGTELRQNLQTGIPAALIDFVLNFTPGFVAGRILGWPALASILLGGVTWISSSGIIAKVLGELGRMKNPETGTVLTVLVLEDLAMAVYLPLVAALLLGGDARTIAVSISIALAVVAIVLVVAIRFGPNLSKYLVHECNEVVLLSIFGTVLLVSGLAQMFQVSAAVGAFLVGVAVSGPIAERSHHLLAPLRDLFAATFFFFFGLEIDPKTLLPVAGLAIALGLVTSLTKVLTGYLAARRAGIGKDGRLRAGMALIARGEFSIVIAGLGLTIEPDLGPVAAAYVLFLALFGPMAARWAK
jgi:monovalent cation:H+ antiporter-2, CPA2 family